MNFSLIFDDHEQDFSVTCLFDEENILIVNKPAGIEVTSESGCDGFADQLKRNFFLPMLQPAHRLDRDTTGLLILAKSENSLAFLEKAFRERKVKKYYIALCLGVPYNKEGLINRSVSEWKRGRRPVQVIRGGGGFDAQTSYHVITSSFSVRDISNGISMILFSPHQGRTHQIRVHSEAFGYPILGDDNYGNRAVNTILKRDFGLSRQALHAWMLDFPLPSGKVNRILCDIPSDMVRICDACFCDWQKILSKYTQFY